MKRLYRSRNDRMIAGIAGGLGEYFGVDPTIIRILWLLLAAVTAVMPAVFLYLLFWLIIPREPAS